jgi:hypothetical protein
MPIAWEKLTQPEFDRLVEAYLTRYLSPRGRVVVLEGRGGDGGVDVDFIKPDGTRTIYQLKCFPEGFSGGFRARRTQITKSFNAAVKENPAKWVLVVPSKMTRHEHRFIRELPAAHKPPVQVEIDYLDQPRLDSGFAEYPDLVDYFHRKDVEDAAKLWNQERAALTDGIADLQARLRGLGTLTDSLDPYWAVDFSYENGTVVHTVRAKTPDAPARSPINIRFRATFNDDQIVLRDKFVQAVEYGPVESISLPASAVDQFRVTGPEWIAEEREGGVQMEWIPIPSDAVGKPLEIRTLNDDEDVIASFRGEVTVLTGGSVGQTLAGSFAHGTIIVTFLLPEDASRPGTLNFTLPSTEVLPGDLVRALSLRRGLLEEPAAEVLLDGHRIGLLNFSDRPQPDVDEVKHFAILREIATDLQVVQRHCDMEFPIPAELTTLDRIYLRCIRLLLEGKCVVIPRAQRLTVTLTGEDSPELRATTGADPTALLLTQEPFRVTLFDHELRLGTVHIFSTRVVCVNAKEIHAALDTHQGAGIEATLEAKDGRHFRFYKPDLWLDENAPLAVSPWSLTGVDEPVDVGDKHGTAIGLDDLGRPRALT